MARWWELAIPAISALSGIALGAWWQGRNAERQIVLSGEAAERATLRAAEREDARRFVAERRVVYVQLIGLVRVFVERSRERADLMGMAAEFDPEDQKALASAEQAVNSTRAAILAKVVETVLMAPSDVRDQAELLGEAMQADRVEDVRGALNAFLNAAKLDLSGSG